MDKYEKEELCVCDADIFAHYDNIPLCFQVALKFNKINDIINTKEWIDYFSKDYNDLSERSKLAFKEGFNTIMNVLFPKL